MREAAGGAGEERARGAARAFNTTPCAAIAAGPSERETPAATKTQYPRIELVRSSVAADVPATARFAARSAAASVVSSTV